MKIKTILTTILLFLMLASSASAANTRLNQLEQEFAFANAAGIETGTTIGDISALVIKTLLSLLGIIFIVLIVYAGYIWMNARGNEEEVKKAQGILRTAIIGLIIVIAAYSITYFIFNALNENLGNPGGIS